MQWLQWPKYCGDAFFVCGHGVFFVLIHVERGLCWRHYCRSDHLHNHWHRNWTESPNMVMLACASALSTNLFWQRCSRAVPWPATVPTAVLLSTKNGDRVDYWSWTFLFLIASDAFISPGWSRFETTLNLLFPSDESCDEHKSSLFFKIGKACFTDFTHTCIIHYMAVFFWFSVVRIW